jgi:hypothetical protein
MGRLVDVAAGDGRQARLGDPAEERRAVEELEPVHEPAEHCVAREALRQPRAGQTRLGWKRVRRDDRGAGRGGRLDRPGDAVVDGDEGAKTHGNGVCGSRWVEVVEGQLETGQEQQAVP